MNLHDVWAEFAAELAHVFARFHSHPVVVAAAAAQAQAAALAPATPATPPAAKPDPLVVTAVGPLTPSTAAYAGGGTPTPTGAGAGPTTTPTESFDHVLRKPGQHFTLAGGPTVWTIPDVVAGVNFGVEIAGMNGASHLTILKPDGTVGQRPPAGGIEFGPADMEFPSAGGSLYVVADQAGTWTAHARNDDPGIQSSIELLEG